MLRDERVLRLVDRGLSALQPVIPEVESAA